jgi:hypothetical protein
VFHNNLTDKRKKKSHIEGTEQYLRGKEDRIEESQLFQEQISSV